MPRQGSSGQFGGSNVADLAPPWAMGCPWNAVSGERAAQFENVSQSLMSPLLRPTVSHFWRCAEDPWVKLSGTA